MKQNISYKTFFINYGIFMAIIAVLIGLLIYTTKLSQKSWSKNLKKSVELVLDEYEPSGWFITNEIKIKNPFSLNAVCFEARNKKNGQVYKTVILRTPTIYGPVPAVFTINKDSEVQFIGYSSVHGRAGKQLMNDTMNRRNQYWQKKIPYIIGLEG